MELIIKLLSGETQTVQVNPSATVGELKQQIAPLFRARPSKLKLHYITDRQIMLDPKTVSDYGLSSGSTVMLLISTTPAPFQVFVRKLKGQMKTYEITADETVDQLMTKVYQKEGIPVDEQRLIYNDRQLESGRKLQDYDIVSGSTFHLNIRLRAGPHRGHCRPIVS